MAASFLQAANSTADASSYTFAAQNLGSAASGRYIVVEANCRKGSSVTLSSVTVGGVAATIVVQFGINGNASAIAIAAVPTGTTGDVVVTWSSGAVRCGIALTRLDQLASATPSATASGGSNGVQPSLTLDIPANGFAIATGCNTGGGTVTWTGLTETHDTLVESGTPMSGANDNFASAQTARSIAATFTGTSGQIVAASWEWGATASPRAWGMVAG